MIEIDVGKRLLSAEGELPLQARLCVERGEFATLFGKSGAGKTTLLRMLAGLTAPDEGRIRAGNEVWFDSERRINLPPQRRRIGFVFQDQALFPHLTVLENLAYALPRQGDTAFLDELLDLTRLFTLRHRLPDTLSGGQRQRVALARALARRPEVLLLDEPLSALDADMRTHLQDEIQRLHRALGVTTVMVSHDLSEVYKLSAKVFVLEHGAIVREGAPAEVFSEQHSRGKFQLPAEVLEVNSDGVMHAVTVLVGNQVLNIVVGDDARELHIGDRVLLLPKTFNPMLLRTGT
jgi:molybdate transport system ATP-binding protein